MLTTFLLHGGQLKNSDERNLAYYQKLVSGLEDGDTVLVIGFARRDEVKRREVFSNEKARLIAATKSKINVINASYANLIGEISSAKVVHIPGGKTVELINDILGYPDFVRALAGKLIGGSSAGACLFAQQYYYDGDGEIHEGLGALPISLMVHYGNSSYGGTDENMQRLKIQAGDLEVISLSECEWISRNTEL